MEKSILRHIANFQEIFEALPIPFLILKPNAPDFTIIATSNAHLKATMTERDRVVNRRLFDVFPGDPDNPSASGSADLLRSLESAIRTKTTHQMPVLKYDIQNENTGGFEERYWAPKNIPVLNHEGEVQFIINQVEDITDVVLSEKRRKEEGRLAALEISEKSMLIEENGNRINKILSVLLHYTNMDFSEKLGLSPKGDELDAIAKGLNLLGAQLESHMRKLETSYHLLEEVNKELDAFSYSVSHDLRAPLRAVNGYSLLVLEDYGDRIDEDGRKCLETIITNAIRMGALIDDLLAFSRLGRQQLTRVLLNMNAMTDSVIAELRGSLPEWRAQITILPLTPAEGDSSMIRQVMTNLIANAIKYSQKKERPVIEIGCREQKDRIVYYVKDNGAGFDMKYYDKLFGVFQRLHGRQEFEGTGVGLALVDRIVKKHGGEVWGEGKTGEGATFYFSLPTITATSLYEHRNT